MIQSTADVAALKAAAAAGAVATVAPAVILGVEGGTLLAAVAGALFALAYSRPEAWGRLFELPSGTVLQRLLQFSGRAWLLAFSVAANAFIAAWSVSAAPHFPGMAWAAAAPAAPLAGLVAFGAQQLVPKALAAAERWFDSRARG